MQRIGLALSGGGFRATLFHLGMIRFLREANILPNVTHITSVSGGSVLAAHLVLHWDRYNGTLKEFDAAAAEVVRFVQLDIRNRVVRRFPLAMPLRALRALTFQRPDRQLTRTGLLEYHYEKYLYGDTSLFQLPERPRLFMLSTNLSEGCLCAFTKDGLLMQRRQPGQQFRFDRIHTGLATLPMAVTASSAFPGFFPPLELQGQDVGADPGQFGRLSFTDGGIYDNLGVRMFRCLERSWLAREIRLDRNDLADADETSRMMQAATQSNEVSPLAQLAKLIAQQRREHPTEGHASAGEPVDQLIEGLWQAMNRENLAREPAFADLTPPDPDAIPLIQAARQSAAEIEPGDQLWLNRQLVEAAFRAAGKPCFRSLNTCFDAVLASDAGMRFKIVNNARAGGLIATAMRSTDIVMDRVWQLETDTFRGAPGFVFAPISKVVSQDEDSTASHPEVQRMSTNIRTDLDRFSPLEISSLVRHGYCVGRSVCRSRPELFGTSIPTEAPWDPLAADGDHARSAAIPASSLLKLATATQETQQSRALQRSSERTLWSTLLDYRDWTSFVYVPLLVPILFILPYYLLKWYHQSQVAQHLIESMAQSSRDYSVMSKLLQEGPIGPFQGLPIEEVKEIPRPDYKGFEVISDTRLLDYRRWKVASESAAGDRPWVFIYRRMRVQKLEATANRFVIQLRGATTKVDLRTLNKRIPATLRLQRDASKSDDSQVHLLEVAFDLSKTPVNEVVDLPIEIVAMEPPTERQESATFYVDAETSLFNCWVLLPEGKAYQDFDLLQHSIDGSTSPELIVPANMLNTADGQMLAFALLKVSPGFKYECRWTYRD